MDLVIPCLNPSPQQLARAIASARKATCITRIIVVDDGSRIPITTDFFACPQDAPDLIITLDRNQGPSAARNAGAAQACAQASPQASPQSDFILFLDCDDELIAHGVQSLLNLTQSLNAFAGIAQRQFDSDANRSSKPLPAGWANGTLPSPAEIFRPIELFSASGLLVRTHVFEQGTRFDGKLLIGEDRDFLRKVATLGPIAVSADPIVLMHRAGNTLTSNHHLARRIADHIVLLDRWCDDESKANFQSATNWLINACSKSSVTDESWQALLDAAVQRGWPVPLKPRVRRLLRTIGRKGAHPGP